MMVPGSSRSGRHTLETGSSRLQVGLLMLGMGCIIILVLLTAEWQGRTTAAGNRASALTPFRETEDVHGIEVANDRDAGSGSSMQQQTHEPSFLNSTESTECHTVGPGATCPYSLASYHAGTLSIPRWHGAVQIAVRTSIVGARLRRDWGMDRGAGGGLRARA